MQTIEAESDNATSVINFPASDAASKSSYEAVRYNARTHGILTRLVVLAHENHADFDSLLDALIDEHRPSGITEHLLIEELGSIIWRKRRVLLAEGATINRSLRNVVSNELNSPIPAAAPFESGLTGGVASLKLMLKVSQERAAEDHEDIELQQRSVRKSKSILRRGKPGAYAKARQALPPELRAGWDSYVAAGRFQADAQSLATYIHDALEPVFNELEKQFHYRSAIKTQTLGEGLQAHRLEKLSRYETHLDRKFERTLAMLLEMKELRGG